MKRAVCVLILGGVLALPAPAFAVPFLSFGEAARVIGRNLHRTWEYGVVTGSLRADCWGRGRNRVGCYISFQDADHDYWCGRAYVRENRAFYSIAYRGMSLC
jgi:hypothetical protein